MKSSTITIIIIIKLFAQFLCVYIKIEILNFFFSPFCDLFLLFVSLGLARYPKRTAADCVAIVGISRKTKTTYGEIHNNNNSNERELSEKIYCK